MARFLQSELEKLVQCEATCWDQDIFELSSFTLEALTNAAKSYDFAVLVATSDDSTTTRGKAIAVPRDNVIFELGLFVGAIGRDRTFLIADRTDDDLHLPSDLAGLTYGSYKTRQDGNIRAALNDAVLGISSRIRANGMRALSSDASGRFAPDPARALEEELDMVCRSALAQGWKVRTRTSTTIRLQDRTGRKHTLSIGQPTTSRTELRDFVRELRASGLRVNRSVRQPATKSVHG